ncbi:alkylphosphonate utilization protein [Aureispira anguillae]|uniref:Alkylphosphonate utilization protein n=1 Tax=Aureispira anguillae TaxID=2864201 RepID=A0A915YAC0_9BACT|nr:alkylphosphonate utilization protein [Aureispira anguillae]BDS09392.1 alkylphosphonate utilization protein [Aureispira anguillae]
MGNKKKNENNEEDYNYDYDYDYNYDYSYKKEGEQEVEEEEGATVKDSNGNVLKDGDSVMPIKDLKVKGASLNLKRGTVIKGIRLTGDDNAVECRIGKKTIVLKTAFLKKK